MSAEERRRRSQAEAIRSDKKRLSLIYDNVSDVIFVLDVEPEDHYRFVSVNKRFLEVTGLREDQILGRSAGEVDSRAGPRSRLRELQGSRPDGPARSLGGGLRLSDRNKSGRSHGRADL